MYFTPYIPLTGPISSLDPHGFLQPGAELTDLLFRQFTVLSHHPAYHGFLCFALNYLDDTGYGSGTANILTKIRDIEIFWGMLSLLAEGESILNITKYRALPAEGLTLTKAKKSGLLYERQNYGAYGHYTGPSVRWGLLNGRDRSLTSLGRELAQAWGARGTSPFASFLKEWLNGNSVLDSHLEELRPYCISTEPSKSEQQVWSKVIENTCEEEPVSGPLWKRPLADETLKLAEAESTHQSFFPTLCEHYSESPQLVQRLHLCTHFEEICALVQCVFDWAYLRKSLAENIGTQASPPEEIVLCALKESIAKFQSFSSPGRLRWTLPDRLKNCYSYVDLEESIIRHHGEHQHRKGAAAFMDTEKILVSGRVDVGRIATLVEKLNDSQEGTTRAAAWAYRRGWYFRNAQRWLRYAGRIA